MTKRGQSELPNNSHAPHALSEEKVDSDMLFVIAQEIERFQPLCQMKRYFEEEGKKVGDARYQKIIKDLDILTISDGEALFSKNYSNGELAHDLANIFSALPKDDAGRLVIRGIAKEMKIDHQFESLARAPYSNERF